MGNRYMTIKELACYIQIPVGTIYNWISAGKIQRIKIGKHVRFDKEYIDRLMKGSTRPAPNDFDFRK